MAINIPNYIKQKLRESGSQVDTRPGSVWSDLVGTPLSHILSDFVTYQDEVVANQSLANVATMSDDVVEQMAANFLVTRNSGNYSTGSVTLYLNNPQQLTVPKGTIFSTADDVEFTTLSDYTDSRQSMQYNRDEYPLYNSSDIPIRAMAPGVGANVDTGMISKAVNWGGTAAKISNRAPITGGQIKETNTELVERIRESIHGANMSSVSGIKKLINSNFPSMEAMEVIGAGHPKMQRDLSLLTSAIENYVEEDFYMIYSGITGSLAKKHKAYWGNFIDLDETASVAKPYPSSFSQEFPDTMYEGLFLKDDLLTSETEYTAIIQEYFDTVNISGVMTPKPIESVLASGNWQVHDGKNPMLGGDGLRGATFQNEFGSGEGFLRLGRKYDLTSEDFEMQLPYTTLSQFQNLLVSTLEGMSESNASEETPPSGDEPPPLN
jgi:hypothetical protein